MRQSAGGIDVYKRQAEEGTVLRSVDEGVLEASTGTGNTNWYNSAIYQEPDAPHSDVYKRQHLTNVCK